MPSPFPGMDPFIQGQIWLDFHNTFCIGLRSALMPQLVPRYVIQVEERLVLETDEGQASYLPDALVKENAGDPLPPASSESQAVGLAVEPLVLTRKRLEPAREVYLQVLEGRSRRVVTVIELLSPWNKAAGGYEDYLLKRDDLLDAGLNLLEIDLVRGGRRIPTIEPLPEADHFAFISRGDEPRKVSVYPWRLRDPLPPLPVPLRPGDSYVTVELQQVFDRVYDEAGYRYTLSYDQGPTPAMPKLDAEWAAQIARDQPARQ